MARLRQISTRNRLLFALNRDDFDLLQPDLEPVALALRQWLIEAGEPIQQVYFPEHGIVSILADTSQGRIEVGLIGPEGMAGLPGVVWVCPSPPGYMGPAPRKALSPPAPDPPKTPPDRPPPPHAVPRHPPAPPGP